MFGNMKMRCINNLKTIALFSVIWVILALIWVAFGMHFYALIWFVVASIVLSLCMYWLSGKLATRIMRASEISEDEEPVLYGIVREVSAQIERPMPHIYVAPTDSPNIFAIGRSERHATICCTRGLLNILNERELRGVVSHELIHVYNHDILNSTIASAIATIVTYIGYVLMYSKNKSSSESSGESSGKSDSSSAQVKSSKSLCLVLRIVGQVLSAIFTPVGAFLIRIAISRARELDADESAGMLTGDPAALASALNKIAYSAKIHEMSRGVGLQAVSSLMIVNPFESSKSKLLNAFSRHPSVKERIDCLMNMAESQEELLEDSRFSELSSTHEGDGVESVFGFKYGGISGGVVAVSGA